MSKEASCKYCSKSLKKKTFCCENCSISIYCSKLCRNKDYNTCPCRAQRELTPEMQQEFVRDFMARCGVKPVEEP